MAQLKNTTISDTGSIVLPSGTTAQRPSSPVAGQIRYNTTINDTEYYDGTAWRALSDSNPEATGGTIVDTEVGNLPYRIHLFTNTGNTNFVVTRAGEIEYLVVGGGGGGGNTSDSGGGGGGGVVFGITNVTPSTYTVTVGSGGARGVNGSSSSIAGIAAAGGGFAGSTVFTQPGGSSGSPQSNPGGAGGGSNSEGGGGGGAGGPGQAAADASSYPGQGGPGLFFGNFVNYIGDNGWVASGGGGGGERPAPLRVPGGGGVGGVPTTQGDRDAIPNTGGGGGGNRDDGAAGGNAARNAGAGGSGVVVIRYRRNVSTSINPNRAMVSSIPSSHNIIQDGLVVHLDSTLVQSYPGSGNTWFDLSGSGNNGTLVGFTGPSAGATSGFDTNTGYMMFGRPFTSGDGAGNNRVTIANSTSLQQCLPQTGMTVSFWVKVTTPVCTAMTKWDGSWEIFYCSGLTWRTQGTGGSDGNASINSSTYRNNFHLITATHSGTERRFYVDGTLIFTGANTVSAQNTTNPVSIGAYADGQYATIGAIPYYLLYNRELSENEVRYNYAATKWRFGV